MQPAEFAILTRGLQKRYGETKALDGLDLAVRAGSVYPLALRDSGAIVGGRSIAGWCCG